MKVVILNLLLLLAIFTFVTSNSSDSTDASDIKCESHLTCTDCVSAESRCDWCLQAHSCTNDGNKTCENDILVTGAGKFGLNNVATPSFCPSIHPNYDASEILVPSGAKKSIKVKVRLSSHLLVQLRFRCQFIDIDGRVTSVNAQLLSDTIYCDPMEFGYSSKSSEFTMPFTVIWGASTPLDNPQNIHVVVYRCNNMSDNCGTCLALSEKYNCGWCPSTSTCEVQDQCSKPDEGTTDWLNRSKVC